MKRAIGIIRVSQVHGREGDRFMSPDIQRERIERDCKAWGLELVDTLNELDVSGGAPLSRRLGLMTALHRVQTGDLHAIVFAYRDRVDRSIQHGSELIRLMDAAGGLLIADGKQITHKTHDGWRHATLESFLNEDQRRAIGAKMADVQQRCVERGVTPAMIPPGYRRREDGVAEPDPNTHQLIWQTWVHRASGRSVPWCQRFLLDYGIDVDPSTISRMFSNRFYLGEIHFGRWSNLSAHEPLVTPQLWEDVQKVRGTLGGRRARSERLLARQGIVRCAACDSRMCVSTKSGHTKPFYRCANHDCDNRPTILASILEPLVIDTTRELCRELVGRANGTQSAQKARAALDEAQAALGRTIKRLEVAGVADEPEAIEATQRAIEARDAAKSHLDDLLAANEAATLAISVGDVFEHGTLDEQRELICAVIEWVRVGKGKGTDRVKIKGRVQ